MPPAIVSGVSGLCALAVGNSYSQATETDQLAQQRSENAQSHRDRKPLCAVAIKKFRCPLGVICGSAAYLGALPGTRPVYLGKRTPSSELFRQRIRAKE
jgi:hypothetical protein